MVFTRCLGYLIALVGLLAANAAAEPPRLADETVLERIAFGSCAHQERPQPIWDQVLAVEPQLFLMIGDNVYGNASSGDMRELAAAYEAQAAQTGFARTRRQVPFLAIWDDHDYGQNDAGADFPHKEKTEALFRRFWGVPDSDPRARRPGLYTAKIVGPPGKRVQIILLDMRTFRSALKPTDRRGARGKERFVPDPDPGKTMLGAAQWSWLADQLHQPAELRLVVSSIQVLADGHGFERWGNLPAERTRLFRLIAETNAEGVIFLSGDRHRGALYRAASGGPYPLYEITSSSLNLPFADPAETGPHQMGTTYGEANFGIVQVDWAAGRARLEIRGPAGMVQRTVQIKLDELKR